MIRDLLEYPARGAAARSRSPERPAWSRSAGSRSTRRAPRTRTHFPARDLGPLKGIRRGAPATGARQPAEQAVRRRPEPADHLARAWHAERSRCSQDHPADSARPAAGDLQSAGSDPIAAVTERRALHRLAWTLHRARNRALHAARWPPCPRQGRHRVQRAHPAPSRFRGPGRHPRLAGRQKGLRRSPPLFVIRSAARA